MSKESGTEDPLYSALVALTRRKLGMGELYDAVGLGSSQYNDLRKGGKLITPDRIIRAARRFNVNAVELLAECALIDPIEAVEYVDERRREAAKFAAPLNPSRPNEKGVMTTDTGTTSAASPRSTKLSEVEIRPDAPSP